MPRVKGAKGKKTLAKEMGMTLEQYEKYLLGKEILAKGLKEINVGAKEEKDKLDKIVQPVQNKLNLEFPDKPASAPEEPEIIVGEQKSEYSIQKQSAPLITDEKIKEVHDIIAKKSHKEKELPRCQRCHQEIKGPTPFRINLNYLTTFPEYHRQTESDHGRVLLCLDCISKLNKIVDKFLFNEGLGVPLKYGATKFMEDS